MTSRFAILALSALALSMTACSKKLEDKLKGSWSMTSVSCGGTDMASNMIPSGTTFTISFDGGSGSTVHSNSSCTETKAQTYTYADDGKSLTTLDGATTCSPGNCSSGAVSCTAAAASSSATADTMNIEFGEDDKTATISMAQDCDGNSSTQETMTATLTKQ